MSSIFKCLLLPLLSHFNDFPVRVRMHLDRKGGAVRRPVLRHQPAGLIPDAAGVAEGLRTERASPPLRRLLRHAMAASPRLCSAALPISSAAPDAKKPRSSDPSPPLGPTPCPDRDPKPGTPYSVFQHRHGAMMLRALSTSNDKRLERRKLFL